jgi:tRNA (uracil-5-)-methyltransferase TRM9
MNKQTEKELLRMVQKNYEEIADQYNETRKKNLFPLWNELIKIMKGIADGDRVLDVGCGNGRLLEAFIGKDIKYLGVDNSEKLLDHARANYPANKFMKADILDLGTVPEYEFDHVVSVAVLHHLPGRELRLKALRQLYNKTKKGGQVVVTVWNLWQHEKYGKLIWRFWLLKLIRKNKMDFGDILWDWKSAEGERVSQRYYHAYNRIELFFLCRKAGFKKIKIFSDKYNYYAVMRRC